MAENICRYCWWYSDEYTSVCVNDHSPNHGRVSPEATCPEFDPDEQRVNHEQ